MNPGLTKVKGGGVGGLHSLAEKAKEKKRATAGGEKPARQEEISRTRTIKGPFSWG